MPKIMKGLAAKLAGVKLPKKRVGSLWQGPCSDGQLGGVTFSMLNLYFGCPERCRLKYVEGLKAANDFNPRLEYGNLWHLGEENHAANVDWEQPVKGYAQKLCVEHPLHQKEIDKWYNVCLKQFPIYVDYWSKQQDVKERTPLLQEYVFDEPYTLPSGRVVRLRGKFDSVDLIGKGRSTGIFLQENKTKSDIDEQLLQRQLSCDLQTMLYLCVLNKLYPYDNGKNYKVGGVRYNVIRRPLSGGKGTIKQLKGSKNRAPETKEEYYNRLQQYFIDDPSYWFMRLKVEISQEDIELFKKRCLEPILENLCDDFEWWEFCKLKDENTYNGQLRFEQFPNQCPQHFLLPFGIWNPIVEAGHTEYDEFIKTGNEVGLVRSDTLFTELQ